MRFDRVVNDIVEWIRRTLWYKNGEIKVKPFEVIETRRGKDHEIRKVLRDTPRAIATYIFVPYRYDRPKAVLRDIHLCCDHLGVLEGDQGAGRRHTTRVPTHRVSVFSASHSLQKDGGYDLKELFSADYDFQGLSQFRDRQANAIMAKIANLCKERYLADINWRFEVESAAKQVLGGSWYGEIKDEDQLLEGTILGDKPRKVKMIVKKRRSD